MQSIINIYYLSTERGACWRLWRGVTWDVDFLTLRLAMRRTFGKNGCNTTPDGGSFRPMTACLHVWRVTPGRSHKKTNIWRAESGWRERHRHACTQERTHKYTNTAPASLCERQINAGYSLTASSSRLCRQIGNREEASKKKNWEGGGGKLQISPSADCWSHENGADRKASDRGRFSAPRHGDVTLAGHVRARTESWHSGTEKTKSETGGKESRRWRRVHKTTRRWTELSTELFLYCQCRRCHQH